MSYLRGLISLNLNAVLDVIGYSESTITSPITKNDGYDVIITGYDGKLEVFNNYSTHPFTNGRPSKKINSKGLTSNASGRYQFMLKDYAYYKKLLKLKGFWPEDQDRWAIQLIKEAGALPFIEAGRFEETINKIAHLWASLPGAGYNQPENKLDSLKAFYLLQGGSL